MADASGSDQFGAGRGSGLRLFLASVFAPVIVLVSGPMAFGAAMSPTAGDQLVDENNPLPLAIIANAGLAAVGLLVAWTCRRRFPAISTAGATAVLTSGVLLLAALIVGA